MFKRFVPDFVYSDIYKIKPERLLEMGIEAIFIDLDGTMDSRHNPKPPKTVKPFLDSFEKIGIKVLVLSNNNEKRVALFCEDLPGQHLSRAKKPFPAAFKRACEVLSVKIENVAVIGDQIYTDTFGGNSAGATTIYVESFDKTDFWIHARYLLEVGFINIRRKLGQKWK